MRHHRTLAAFIAGALMASGCSSAKAEPPATVALNEPSGMAASSSEGQFWLVSDAGTDISLVDLSGAMIETITVDVADSDWEGIVELSNGNLLVAEERRLELIEIDPRTAEVVRVTSLTEMNGFADVARAFSEGDENKGLEGVTRDSNGSVWVVKESEPALLIALDSELTRIESWIDPSSVLAAHLGIDADVLDLSGLAPHADTGNLWILSHQASTAFVWNTLTSTVEESHELDLDKAEGIALHDSGVLIVDENSGELVTIEAS